MTVHGSSRTEQTVNPGPEVPTRIRWWAIPVVVAALVPIACGSSEDDSSRAANDRGSASTAATEAPATTTAPTTTAAPPLPAAADGTDLGACRDGGCEVLVETFPTEVMLDGLPPILLESADAGGVTWGRSGGGVLFTSMVGQAASLTPPGSDRQITVVTVGARESAAVVQIAVN
jgi:hypothetical protein